jgi:hypothetical protein
MAEGEGAKLPGASAAGAMTGLIGAWDRAEVVLNVRKAGVRRGSREGPAMADRVTLRGRKSRRAVRAEEDMTSDVSGVLIELAICGISVRESDLIHQRPEARGQLNLHPDRAFFRSRHFPLGPARIGFCVTNDLPLPKLLLLKH